MVGPLRGLSLDQGVGNVLVRPQNPGIYRFRGRNTPSCKSVHTLKYELGSVLRRGWPGYSDLGVRRGRQGRGQIYVGCTGETPGKMVSQRCLPATRVNGRLRLMIPVFIIDAACFTPGVGGKLGGLDLWELAICVGARFCGWDGNPRDVLRRSFEWNSVEIRMARSRGC